MLKRQQFSEVKKMTKILPFLTARYTILCTRRLQPPRDDCAVRAQWFSSVVVGILTCMSRINFLLSWFEQGKSFITSRPGAHLGGTLIFLYIRRLGPFFFLFKTLHFNILGGFQKNEDVVDFFFLGGGGGEGESSQNCTIFKGHFYAF